MNKKIIVFLFMIFLFFFILLNNNTIIASTNNEYIDDFIHYDAIVDLEVNNIKKERLENTSTNVPTFSLYKKGDTNLNIIFNFVNYSNDTTHILTDTEIQNKMNDFSVNLEKYWSAASLNKLHVNVDYITCTAPLSYDEYLSKSSASYSIENTIFTDSLNASNKEFDFTTYQVKINVFAGNTGSWNTFLWPHAYSGSGLIMLVESNMITSTLCHELGHVLGAPDLYAYTGSQCVGVSYLDLMGSGYDYQSINACTRNQLGFVEISDYGDDKSTSIENLNVGNSSSYTSLKLYPSYSSDSTKTIAYKFGEYTNGDHKEYFMVEYRVKNYNSYLDPAISSSSVVVYRVNEASSGNSNANESSGYAEIVYMGNQYYDVSSSNYISSVLLKRFGSIGSTKSSYKTLCYTGGAGKSNMFTGPNSKIVVEVKNLSSEYATINIKYSPKGTITADGFKWENTCVTYDGELHLPTLLTNNDKITYNVLTNAQKDVGTYTCKIEFVYDELNYILSESLNDFLTCEFTIVPKQLTIKPMDYTYTYDLVDYRNKIQIETINGNFISNDLDNIDFKISVDDFSLNVGTYTIKLTGSDKNYDFTILDGTYKIVPAKLSIFIDRKYSFYGQDLVPLTYSLIEGSVLDGDELGIELTKEEGLDAGSYEITGTWDNSNYDVKFSSSVYDIFKSEIDVELYDTKYIYDGDYHFIDFKVNNVTDYDLYYGFDEDDISYTNLYIDKFKNAGSFDVYMKISAGPNYNDFVVCLELTIDPMDVTIKVNDIEEYEGYLTYDYSYTVSSNALDEIYDYIEIYCDVEDTPGRYNIDAKINSSNYYMILDNGVYNVLENTTYYVTYQLMGSINPIENIYSYKLLDNNVYELKDPFKEGYTFKGWFNQDDERVYCIDASLNEHITLTASFKKNSIFDCTTGNVILQMISMFSLISICLLFKKSIFK